MTEVPEHLLQRSKAARARLSGAPAPDDGGAAAPSSAPATAAAATPAVAAAAAVPEVVVEEPKTPWVQASEGRPKIPVWALSVLVCLPIWAIVYATTNDLPTVEETGALAVGAETFTSCSACHGGTGGGGSGPALADGAVLETFPEPGAQVRWVLLGSAGYSAEGSTTYGAQNKPVNTGMPSHTTLTAEELLAVIRHERETLSNEEFDLEAWNAGVEALLADPNPEVSEAAAEYEEVIASWDH